MSGPPVSREPVSAVSSGSARPVGPAIVEVRAPSEHEEGSRSQILRWLKAAGERVERDEPLLEVETDKVTVEIAAPAAGVLKEILKSEQEEIGPGALLARIAVDGASAAGKSSAMRRAAATDGGAEMADAAAPLDAPIPAAGDAAPSTTDARARFSPAVKRLISELALDPGEIPGSGAGGRITVDDVLRHAEARCRVPIPSPPPGPSLKGRLVPHSPTRRRIADHMVRSLLQTAPHVTTVFEADFSAVLAHRARHREALASRGIPLTLTAYIVAACVDAIRAVPEANARWTHEALEIFDAIHIGVGTAVEGKGLIVPVVHDVATLDLDGIARELGRLVNLAREDRLAPADVRGGTFTISNHGVSGSLIAAPIVIHQPQVAILGVGKVEKRPVVLEESGNERIVARPRGFLTLTIDHRALDGDRANRFLDVLVKRLESWPVE